jgi:hypothetical protein
MGTTKLREFVFFLILILPLSLCFGQDERSKPVEIYVMFDNSVSMKASGQEAASWVSNHIVDNILQADDSLTIWSLADNPNVKFSGTISTQENKEEIKTVLDSIAANDNTANYEAVFGEIQKKSAANPQYVLLVTGISGQNASLFNAGTAEFLKYSLSKDFPGWKVMIIGMGIEQKVKAAAAAYMSSQR